MVNVVRFLPLKIVVGIVGERVTTESEPMLIVNVPVSVSPPEEVKGISNVVSPRRLVAKASTGSIVKVQLLPAWETETRLESAMTASLHDTVWAAFSVI